jgi:phosphate transport system protein
MNMDIDKERLGKHISQQFNAELEHIRNRVLAMGGLVEQQLLDAVNAFIKEDVDLAEQVISNDMKVNSLEVAIDEECAQVIARRQPTAGDLRLLVAVIKTITDLERMGDQAERVARMAVHLSSQDHRSRRNTSHDDLRAMGNHVASMVHDALDAFARLDVEAALRVPRDDLDADRLYESIMRQQLTFIMEDPRSISRSLDIMWAARALERVGDHSRNICEYIIYLVKGKDVRHISIEEMEQAVRAPR